MRSSLNECSKQENMKFVSLERTDLQTMRNGKLSLSLTSKSKHLVRWIKSGRVSNQSLIFFLFVSSGTHLALVDAIATTSVSVMAPDTSIWEEETLAIDHDSRKVFLRFDLSRIQNYGALYGDKWTAKLRIFMKGMMPHVLTPVAPRCILSHYNQPKKDKLKASEQLFGSKKVDLSEWSWAPYELTWMTRPRSGGVEISRMSCGANTFVEFSVTNIVAQVLAEPVSRRQLTLSLETEDHVVFMTTAQQKHLELFPVITFQRKLHYFSIAVFITFQFEMESYWRFSQSLKNPYFSPGLM
eukprot:TRINITY_DN4848_c0_g2_i1.p1 TRINITY_DN4848_c0_g2~~TRINITY_DN4848_c0_g2_i1.p1  ORF type:complete len:298 (+),score=45.57 TRINITY_DN4848_c0_g2_i1:270-1163(+)